MNRPDSISVYDELDLKLGIKSSLPHVKSTLALSILLWECSDRPAELIYSTQNGDAILSEQVNMESRIRTLLKKCMARIEKMRRFVYRQTFQSLVQ